MSRGRPGSRVRGFAGPCSGRDDKLCRLADGKELIGQTLWLRAQEIGGPRVLSYRFTAEQ